MVANQAQKEYQTELRTFRNWDAAWLLMNERPDDLDEYVVLKEDMKDFHDRIKFMKTVEAETSLSSINDTVCTPSLATDGSFGGHCFFATRQCCHSAVQTSKIVIIRCLLQKSLFTTTNSSYSNLVPRSRSGSQQRINTSDSKTLKSSAKHGPSLKFTVHSCPS